MTTTQIASREFWRAEKVARQIFNALPHEQVVRVEHRDPVDGRTELIHTYSRTDFPQVPEALFESIDDSESGDDTDIIRVQRVLTYEGERQWVRLTLSKSLPEGECKLSRHGSIRSETLNSEAVTA